MNNCVVTFAVSRRFSSMERAGKVDPQERLHLSPYQQAGLTRCAIYQMIHRPQCPVKFHRGKKAQKSGKTVENIQLQNVFSTQFVWLVSLFLVFAKFCATLGLYNIVLLMCVDFVYILSRGVSIKGKGGISKT